MKMSLEQLYPWYCFDNCGTPFYVLSFDGDNMPACCPFCGGVEIRQSTIEDFEREATE